MKTLVCVLCCLEVLCPLATDINEAIIDEFDCITYAITLEDSGRYLVGVMTTPFFLMSEKLRFVDSLKTYIASKLNITKYDVFVTFDLSIIHEMKNVSNKQDIKNLIDKVAN